MKRNQILLTALLSIGSLGAFAQTSRLQVIHNSADTAAPVVDVYANGTILLNDVSFRTSSPFSDVPAGVPISIAIAPGNSTSAAQAVYTTTVTFTSGSTYVAVANGIVSTTGYSPSTPFELSLYDMGREAASNSANTDVLVAHGGTDAGTVDVRTMGGAAPLVNDIAFGDFSNYLELPTADYVINVTTPNGMDIAGSFQAPLSTLGLGGKALVVVASGFLDPVANSNGADFGLWVSLPEGGALVELPINTNARLQAIHNSADAAAASVDVYAGASLLLDNFGFRTASPFVTVPAGSPIDLGVAPSTSTSAGEAIFTKTFNLEAGRTYILVASGIVSATGYTPAPAFDLLAYDMGREMASSATNTDILVMHGCTDAPTVDLKAGTATLVDDISYGEFEAEYLELPTQDYTLALTLADGATVVNNYSAPLQTLGLAGKSLVALASGFLDPSVNSASANTFGIWVAMSEGGALVQLPLGMVSVKNVQQANQAFSLYPNPTTGNVFVNSDEFKNADVTIFDLAGRVVSTQKLNNQKMITTNAMVPGTYLVQLIENGKTGYQRFSKN